MNRIQFEDCQHISKLPFIDWEKIKGKSILITGGTGLVGSNLVNALTYADSVKKLDIKVVLPVRNTELATRIFGNGNSTVHIMPYSLGERLDIAEGIDYIVHLASPTSSIFFVEKPVDTITANVDGMRAVLELAREKNTQKVIYLSTMEVYGSPGKDHPVLENELGSFETMKARNSYPIAKIASEALCNAYWTQYGIPAVVLRATQTFGPGIRYDDSRVFAQFIRCALEGKDIVLKSAGLTERPYLYTGDAVSAVIACLLNGVPGQAYTVANPETYCSIKEMAHIVSEEIAGGEINVIFDIVEDVSKLGYAETVYFNLDISKMKQLGWSPRVCLREMFERTIKGIQEDEKQNTDCSGADEYLQWRKIPGRTD